MTLRLIQVGMGGWGVDWNHNIVQPSADFKLVACVDSSAVALERAQQMLNLPQELYFDSMEAALERTDADAALITAALPGHVPLALAALDAGKHVLVEKPFAPTLAEARRLVEVADQRGRILMVSQNYRFYPAARTVAALVREGTFGEVGSITVDFRRYANTAPREGHRHYTITHPMLIDMAIHHFDLMRMILAQEPRQITCHAWNPPWSNFVEPAAAVATILFDGGTVVNYQGNWVSPAPQTAWAGEWRMECAGGMISWTGRGGLAGNRERVTLRPLRKAARRVELPDMPQIDRAGSLAAFAQAVRDGRTPESSGRENLGSIALMNAAVESATSGLTIPVIGDR